MYKPNEIEKKWRKYWEENQIYKVSNYSDLPKFYILDMFPYPSGAGLHVGHPLGYIASDIYARYKRMTGYNVLHPMGYDAFGLPAEQYAIETGVHPAVSTKANIEMYRSQLDNIGFSYDWSRQVQTSLPQYYKWTQWIFIHLFENWYDKDYDSARPISELINKFDADGTANVNAATANELRFTAADWQNMSPTQKDDTLMHYRLAFRQKTDVNWCEALGTVLSNDEVKDGFSERGGHPVVRRSLLQWSLRITAYADRLLKDLEIIDWPNSMKKIQSNWIGKSTGAQLFFEIKDHPHAKVEVYTTRPDTIYGVTFLVLAPEHDLVVSIVSETQKKEVGKYLKYVQSRSDIDRQSEAKEVTGVNTGAFAIHPLTKEPIPIYLGEYVFKDYGTGAIMAVPSDDDRDYRFAEKFGIKIIDVIDKSKYPGSTRSDKKGIMKNSDFLNGLEVPEAIDSAIIKIQSMAIGDRKTTFKMHDAGFSRQRYWGEPIPIVYDRNGVAHSLPVSELPLNLPELDRIKPGTGGKSPLARASEWVNLPDGWTRETDTMPGYAGSSWYFLRYMDPNNKDALASKEALDYWQSVDLYLGGKEHGVGHLLYARFWHKFLYDKGIVNTNEPFKKLINQGMILGLIEYIYKHKEKTKDGRHHFVSSEIVQEYSEEEQANFIQVPVHVDFVENYGASDSYLSIDGIKRIGTWRSEYSNAIYEGQSGIWQDQTLIEGSRKEDFRIQTVSEVGKMSKRYYNVVNPDDIVDKYGADTFRMYEMFLGPIDQAKPWDTKGINGVFSFVRKLYGLFYDNDGNWLVLDSSGTNYAKKVLHKGIKKVREDIERFSFNTCVSTFMQIVNDFKKNKVHDRDVLITLVKLLAPFAPYVSEELWNNLGKNGSVHHTTYPQFEASYLIESDIEYPLSINGKKRATAIFSADANKDDLESAALSNPEIQKFLEGKEVKKVIIVPKRMINIVVS